MFPSLREIPGAEDDNRPEALLAAVCAAPAKVIVGNTVSVVEEKAPFQPPLFAHTWHFSLLSAVSAGVAVSAVILYHLGIIFGVFLPCKPVKKSFGIADRVRGSPLVLYGFGYILGRFLSLLFLLFHRLALPA